MVTSLPNTSPLKSASASGHVVRSAAPATMFTAFVTSLPNTSPLRSQSSTHSHGLLLHDTSPGMVHPPPPTMIAPSVPVAGEITAPVGSAMATLLVVRGKVPVAPPAMFTLQV